MLFVLNKLDNLLLKNFINCFSSNNNYNNIILIMIRSLPLTFDVDNVFTKPCLQPFVCYMVKKLIHLINIWMDLFKSVKEILTKKLWLNCSKTLPVLNITYLALGRRLKSLETHGQTVIMGYIKIKCNQSLKKFWTISQYQQKNVSTNPVN